MTTKQPSPYVPAFLKAAIENNRPLQLTFSEVKDSNILSTSSFIYDAQDAPLKSTQQLNVDWSKFENHTFFMSAEAKVNLAFEQVINGFPFDGTRQEVESFFEKMTGFDRYVFDQFPKFHGQLMFSGTQVGETLPNAGTYIVVKDAAGSLYPELSKAPHGQAVLNPRGTSLSIEMQVYLPVSATVGTQVICQKISGSTQGFTLYLVPTTSTSSVEARFSVASGSFSLTVPCILDKGRFNHICVELNRETGAHYLEFFKAGESANVTKSRYTFGDFDIDASDFTIGSGTVMTLGPAVVTPNQTFSGTLDEFRLFHNARTADLQQQFAAKAIFAQPDLKLYYRFNEPPPLLATPATDQANSIVIDSSGHALHSVVTNFNVVAGTLTGVSVQSRPETTLFAGADPTKVVVSASLNYSSNTIGATTYYTSSYLYAVGPQLRQNAALDPTSEVIFEKEESCPVLFPAFDTVVDLNSRLLNSATLYDKANPNLITRLVPQHYLLEGTVQDGFEEPEGAGGAPYGGNGIPGQGKLGSVQLLLSMLYIWARFFDEMKLFVDAFSSVRTVEYDTNKSTPNNFLRDLIRLYGFHLPPLFNDSTLEQYLAGENIGQEISSSETPLKHVQNELLRRILINLPDVVRSKGTQHSIKVFLRAVGIDPENSVRLREFGGPTVRQLQFTRESKREVGTMVEFISSSLVLSPYLSASRYEPGYPAIRGQFVQADKFPPNGISNDPNDGLLTSGSWTVETIVKFTPVEIRLNVPTTQSLVRMCVTGSTNFMTGGLGLIANLLAVSSSVDPKVILYFRPGTNAASPLLHMSMSIPNNAIFDGDKWNVSFGCTRNDAIGSRVSSSYFLRLGSQNNGELQHFQTTSSFFYELITSESNCLRTLSSSFNQSGSFVAVGTNQAIPSGSGASYFFLNNTSIPGGDPEMRVTAFTGMQTALRFWSKALTEDEWAEHVRNHRSLGVEDPTVNYNFVTTRSGSFEKVRMDTLGKQDTRRANATSSLGPLGTITFLDFSLNGNHLTGSGFPIDKDCVKGELFDISYLSPYFDEAVSNEKVRIRSFQNQDLVDATPWAGVAPIYEIVKSEQPTDDTRFSVEFSLIDALNRDIITLFATLDAIDNAIGSPELVFSPDYPGLETLRNVYFNRIHERLNFKAFFEFFRWFDVSIGSFIQQLIPRKTNFKGTNFVIESHMLERHKLEYLFNEIYLGEEDRSRIRDVLLLQQIAGSIRKY